MRSRPDEATPDEALIAEYLGDRGGARGRAALSGLIERWSGRVYGWAFRVVRERESALDLAQESLMQMVEALPRYEPRGKFSAWLFVIVHRRCLSAVRRRSLDLDREIDGDSLGARGAGPDAEHESAAAMRRIFAVMEQVLDPRERAALWLRAYEGMSVEDITQVLRVDGASGARGLLQTARRKLRAALDHEGGS